MNIVGEGLSREIANQVKKRQEIYGSINRTTEEILYLNSRTAFVKAISSVDIVNYDIKNIEANRPELASILTEYAGSKLAKNFILFNGTSTEGGSQRSGIPQSLVRGSSAYVNNLAYGLGGLEYGARPMPGITSMQTTSKGAYGSVEETILNIKAWNRIQFEIIDILYLRLGYGVLVEWGNVNYFNNNGEYIPNNQYTVESEFLAAQLNPVTIYDKIQQYRLTSNGNYDAIYGIVTNFNWTFDEDGGYTITVKLLSKGDIIESLKTGVLISEGATIDIPEISDTTLKAVEARAITQLESFAIQDATSVNLPGFTSTDIAFVQQSIQKSQEELETNNFAPATVPGLPESIPTVPEKDSSTLARLRYDIEQLFNSKDPNISYSIPFGSGIYKSGNSIPYFYQIYKTPNEQDSATSNPDAKYYYIRLGSLLAFIQDNLVLKTKQGGKLYSSIKMDYATNSNLCYTNDYQVSTDPTVCIINTSIPQNATVQPPFTPGEYIFAPNAASYKKTIAKTQVGQIMNIYVNMDKVLEIVNTNGDPKNQTSVYNLLNTLCNSLSIALGGINTFRPFIDTTTNTFRIIDETSIPNRGAILTELNRPSPIGEEQPEFQVYGFLPTTTPQSGFVRNLRFNSKLSPELSTIIAVGASRNGGVIGEDATALSTLNRGLIDRIDPEKTQNKGYSAEGVNNLETQSPEDIFKTSLSNFERYLGSIGIFKDRPTTPILNQAEVSSYTNLLCGTIMPYIESQAAIKSKKASGTMGFIPVSMGLTLDGLSGLKLLNGIKINTSYLPSNYPETMLFIVSKLAHKVENNIWTTELETIMSPDDTIQADAKLKGKNRGQGGDFNSSRNSGGSAADISNLDLTQDWIDIAFAYIAKKETFTPTAKWDVTKYRLGYGTDKILGSDGKIRETRQKAPFETTTIEDATKVLKFEIATTYKNRVVGTNSYQITETQWESLSNPAKAALVSRTYNAGNINSGGVDVASAIKTGNLSLAATLMAEVPITDKFGKIYNGLITRRKEESLLFLS